MSCMINSVRDFKRNNKVYVADIRENLQQQFKVPAQHIADLGDLGFDVDNVQDGGRYMVSMQTDMGRRMVILHYSNGYFLDALNHVYYSKAEIKAIRNNQHEGVKMNEDKTVDQTVEETTTAEVETKEVQQQVVAENSNLRKYLKWGGAAVALVAAAATAITVIRKK